MVKYKFKMQTKATLAARSSELTNANNKLHTEIWRLVRRKDNGLRQMIESMRKEIDENHRKLREVEYLKRADEQLWESTTAYLLLLEHTSNPQKQPHTSLTQPPHDLHPPCCPRK